MNNYFKSCDTHGNANVYMNACIFLIIIYELKTIIDGNDIPSEAQYH